MERAITIRCYQDDIRPLVFDHNTFDLFAQGKNRSKTWDIIFVDFLGYDAIGRNRKLSYNDRILRLQSRSINMMQPVQQIYIGNDILSYSMWMPKIDQSNTIEKVWKESFIEWRQKEDIQN